MRVPPLEYHDPDSLTRALALLQPGDGPAAVLAGGTDIVVALKYQVKRPQKLIDLQRIPGLAGIEHRPTAMIVGAMTRLSQVAADPTVRSRLPALAEAVRVIGSPNLRNLGTLGGNLCLENRCKWFNQSAFWRGDRPPCFKAGGERCYVVSRDGECHATYSADLAPVLMVLGATVEIAGPAGPRQQPLADLFSGDGFRPLALSAAGPEIVTAVEIPLPAPHIQVAYLKARPRTGIDFPDAGVALWLDRDGPLCREVRIAVTGTTTAPVRAYAAEDLLRDQSLSPALIAEAARLATRAARPINTGLMSAAHKRLVVDNLVREAFRQLLENDRS